MLSNYDNIKKKNSKVMISSRNESPGVVGDPILAQ